VVAKTGRLRKNDPAGLRARVLDQAATLFQARGYHATAMRDVMDATGVSAGARRAAAATFVVASYSGAVNLAKAMQSASPLRSAAKTLSQWLSERDFDA
jgi:hypothetical protein